MKCCARFTYLLYCIPESVSPKIAQLDWNTNLTADQTDRYLLLHFTKYKNSMNSFTLVEKVTQKQTNNYKYRELQTATQFARCRWLRSALKLSRLSSLSLQHKTGHISSCTTSLLVAVVSGADYNVTTQLSMYRVSIVITELKTMTYKTNLITAFQWPTSHKFYAATTCINKINTLSFKLKNGSPQTLSTNYN